MANSDPVERLFDIHGSLVDIETCIKQLGVVCFEAAQPSGDIDYDCFLYFLSHTLRMYSDVLGTANDEIDAIRRELAKAKI